MGSYDQILRIRLSKLSLFRYLLGRDFPGQRIGPEPTTDRFTVLINGPEERTIPGNALSVHPDLPFRGLERFGVSFLSRFEGSQHDAIRAEYQATQDNQPYAEAIGACRVDVALTHRRSSWGRVPGSFPAARRGISP